MKRIIYTLLILLAGITIYSCDNGNNTPKEKYEVSNVMTNFIYKGYNDWYKVAYSCDIKNNTNTSVEGRVAFSFNTNTGRSENATITIGANQSVHIVDTLMSVTRKEKDSGIKKVSFEKSSLD